MSLLCSIKNIYCKAETPLKHHSLWTSACYLPMAITVFCEMCDWQSVLWFHLTGVPTYLKSEDIAHRKGTEVEMAHSSVLAHIVDNAGIQYILSTECSRWGLKNLAESSVICEFKVWWNLQRKMFIEVPCFSRIRVPWIRCLLKTRLQPQSSLTDSQLIGESWGEEQAAWKYLNCGSLYVS